MIRGRVIGEVWATRKAPALAGRKLVLVGVSDADRAIVAIDPLDAREGDQVLVALGSGARNVLEPGPDNRQVLADAAVAMIVDGEG